MGLRRRDARRRGVCPGSDQPAGLTIRARPFEMLPQMIRCEHEREFY